MIDRQSEQSELRRLLQRGTPQLALIYGRRRVGKTFLLTNTWPPEITFYFTAAATTPDQNRRQLIEDVARWSGQAMVPDDYPNWRTVFRMLLDLRAPQPLVVVLDEFQYLGETQTALEAVTSELNAAWEQRRESRPLVLVLAGSSVRTLEALDAGSAPLHGRFSWKARLEAFDYCHAAEMARFRSLRDRAYLYGIFGGTPRFLAAVDPGESLADNAARLMLDPRGEVRALVETALMQEQGLREVPRYTAILRAIGSGSTELNEIGQAAGLQGDTGLRQKVERLVGLGYVQQRRNLGARPKEPYRYRLGDPALMFYHAFVAPLGTTLERTPARRVWRDEVVPRMDTYMGHVFERMAEQAYRRRAERLPIVREWGFWEGLDSERKALEMDIACQLTDGRVMTGGVKWNSRPLTPEWHLHHLKMLDRLAASGVKWAHIARERSSPIIWVAAGGFSAAFADAVRASRDEVILWSLKDLYPSAQKPKAASRNGGAREVLKS
ncbi:MAG TPA: ATP-binding protein [Longimicrobium sp.]|nr:ATP-binding protein [Longimicrobium sp.]